MQGTAEGAPFSRAELDALLGLAEGGIAEIIALQQRDGRGPARARGEPARSSPPATPTRSRRSQAILGAGVVRRGPRPGVEETGDTFEANALLKARALRRRHRRAGRRRRLRHRDRRPRRRTGHPLGPVDRGGATGSRGCCASSTACRRADAGCRYVCAAAAVVARRPRGRRPGHGRGPDRRGARAATAGFGYDPIVVPVEGDGRTFAEMTADEKHAISHRARAVRGPRAAALGSPAAEVDLPHVDDLVAVDHVEALVLGDGRVDVGGDDPDPVADRHRRRRRRRRR